MKKIYTILLTVIILAGSSFTPTGNVELYTGEQVKIVRFYPNPASSVINFEFQRPLDKSYTLNIYSFIGKEVKQLQVTGDKISLSLDGFYRGLYVFQLRDKTGRIVESGKFQIVK